MRGDSIAIPETLGGADMMCVAENAAKSTQADESREFMQQVSALLGEGEGGPANRRFQRFPIDLAMRLVPKCDRGKMLLFSPIEITGKDISSTGIGFTHDKAIADKLVVIVFISPGFNRFAVEAEIIWTKSKSHDEFESGCRLIRKLSYDDLVAMF
jgi:hypothetical protein